MSLFPFRTNRTPAAPPTPTVPAAPVVTDIHRLAVSKALRQIEFIAQSFGLENCPTRPDRMADIEHDLTVFHAYDDLKTVNLELLSRDKSVIAEFKFEFLNGRPTLGGRDLGNGIELPFINRALVAAHRFIVIYNGKPRTYQSLLKLSWSDAPTLPRQDGKTFDSEHATRISGGRQHASFFVAEGLRRRLRIVEAGRGDFAFAQDLDSPGPKVYLHTQFAPAGMQFQIGRTLRATVVQTPRGLQARNIEPVM